MNQRTNGLWDLDDEEPKTDEEKRVQIAEILGCEHGYRHDGTSLLYSDPEMGSSMIYWRESMTLFDPLNDLNAMHEAEAALTPAQMAVFGDVLNDIVSAFYEDYYDGWQASYVGQSISFAASMFVLAHATARQRAEAFLRTMNS